MVTVLQSGSQELTKRPDSFCEAKSVIQDVLKSAPTDCRLQDFQDLVSRIKHRCSIRCTVFPSDYSVQFPSPSRTRRLGVQFETDKDMCDALELDIHDREIGVYREKGNIRRNLRAIQVIGVDMRDRQDRKLLLGRSFPTSVPTDVVPLLHQDRAVWREGSWEKGFRCWWVTLKSISAPVETTYRGASISNPKRNSDLNCQPHRKHMFPISWEVLSGFGSHTSEASNVPGSGSLRVCLPVVILRSRILTASTKSLFETRFYGRFSKQIIATDE